MAEVFGAFGWHEGLREMKWIADHMLVRGINWFTPHAFSMGALPRLGLPAAFFTRTATTRSGRTLASSCAI